MRHRFDYLSFFDFGGAFMQKVKSSLSLNKHFAALGAAAAAVTGVGMVQQADAAIVYHGAANINIPTTTSGVYLNVVSGVNATAPAGAPGWDINPWGSGSFFLYGSGTGNGFVNNFAGGTGTGVDNLPLGTVVDGSLGYLNNSTETTGPTAFVLNSSANYGGFRFVDEVTGGTRYGWAQFSLSTSPTAQPRTIVAYAYEDSGAGIAVGATGGTTPEPASLGLLALGAVGLLRRRSA